MTKTTAPPWPLRPVLEDQQRLDALRLALVGLLDDIDTETDKVRRYRARKRADKLRRDLFILERKVATLTAAEARLWAEVWTRPQAKLWHRKSAAGDVALYVRMAVRAEHCDWRAASEARQWSDRLGLNPLALTRLRWADAVAQGITNRRQARTARFDPAALTTARDRARRPLP